jgi:hypothetical protein
MHGAQAWTFRLPRASWAIGSRGKNVNDRYGRISDQELIQAIDRMTFDHGETEIHVARDRQGDSEKKGNKKVTTEGSKRKKTRALS